MNEHVAYIDTLKKLATEGASPGVLHHIGQGIKDVPSLWGTEAGTMGGHVADSFAARSAHAAQELGNETLGMSQKIRPALGAAWEGVKKFKRPLMGAGILGAAGLTAASALKGAWNAGDSIVHPQNTNVFYGR